jgi:tetratricopeptide (TPR) repeat protein
MRFWRLILALAFVHAPLAWGQLTLELQDDLDQTVSDIQTLWKAKETDIDAYRVLLGRLDMLEEHADEMPPSFQEEILRYRSNTFLRTKQFEEAVVGFQRMVDEFPDAKGLKYRQNMVKNLESWLDPAKQALREELNETNKAIRSLLEAEERNPSAYAVYLETLARLEAEADQMPPRFLEGILILTANTYERTGRPGEAIRDYQRMIDLFPQSKYTDQRKMKIRRIEARMGGVPSVGESPASVATVDGDADIVGMWSADIRSRGGLGGQWTFTGDGKATFTFGALVDYDYAMEGEELVTQTMSRGDSLEEPMREHISFEGGLLTKSGYSMKRTREDISGEHVIVGEWTAPSGYMEGMNMIMRYSNDGTGQLSMPMTSEKGDYRIDGGRIIIVKALDSSEVIFNFERTGNRLTLWQEPDMDKRHFTLFEY